jgi:hypothetical protein
MTKNVMGYVAPAVEVVAAVVENGFGWSNGVEGASIEKYEVVNDVEW